MKKSLFALLGAAIIALAGCNGIKKVEFSEFKDKVAEAAKAEAPDYEKYVFNGTIKNDGKETKYDKVEIAANMSVLDKASHADVISLVTTYNAAIAAITEDEDTSYYVGLGFRVKKDKDCVCWDKYCHVTKIYSVDGDDKVDITVRWTYAK